MNLGEFIEYNLRKYFEKNYAENEALVPDLSLFFKRALY